MEGVRCEQNGGNYVGKEVMVTLSCVQRSEDLVQTSIVKKRMHVRVAAMKSGDPFGGDARPFAKRNP